MSKHLENIKQELYCERLRWDCPNYHCTIVTSEKLFEDIMWFCESWDNITYNRQRNLITLRSGGQIQLQALEGLTEVKVEQNNGGCEYTTVIFNFDWEICKLSVQGINYLMARLRSESKYDSRMVIC